MSSSEQSADGLAKNGVIRNSLRRRSLRGRAFDGSGDLYGENPDGTEELVWEMTPQEVTEDWRELTAKDRLLNPQWDDSP